jgi:ankyrin repeat protein
MYIYQWKKTPLYWAAEKGHDKIVETFVEAKADLCTQNQVGV